jgi:hypothetical protein
VPAIFEVKKLADSDGGTLSEIALLRSKKYQTELREKTLMKMVSGDNKVKHPEQLLDSLEKLRLNMEVTHAAYYGENYGNGEDNIGDGEDGWVGDALQEEIAKGRSINDYDTTEYVRDPNAWAKLSDEQIAKNAEILANANEDAIWDKTITYTDRQMQAIRTEFVKKISAGYIQAIIRVNKTLNEAQRTHLKDPSSASQKRVESLVAKRGESEATLNTFLEQEGVKDLTAAHAKEIGYSRVLSALGYTRDRTKGSAIGKAEFEATLAQYEEFMPYYNTRKQ